MMLELNQIGTDNTTDKFYHNWASQMVGLLGLLFNNFCLIYDLVQISMKKLFEEIIGEKNSQSPI